MRVNWVCFVILAYGTNVLKIVGSTVFYVFKVNFGNKSFIILIIQIKIQANNFLFNFFLALLHSVQSLNYFCSTKFI